MEENVMIVPDEEIGGDEQLAQQVVAWSSVLSMGTIFCFAAALRAMGVM